MIRGQWERHDCKIAPYITILGGCLSKILNIKFNVNNRTAARCLHVIKSEVGSKLFFFCVLRYAKSAEAYQQEAYCTYCNPSIWVSDPFFHRVLKIIGGYPHVSPPLVSLCLLSEFGVSIAIMTCSILLSCSLCGCWSCTDYHLYLLNGCGIWYKRLVEPRATERGPRTTC